MKRRGLGGCGDPKNGDPQSRPRRGFHVHPPLQLASALSKRSNARSSTKISAAESSARSTTESGTRPFRPGVIDQDPAHGFGGGEEVGPVTEGRPLVLADSEERFVIEGRGWSVCPTFSAFVRSCAIARTWSSIASSRRVRCSTDTYHG